MSFNLNEISYKLIKDIRVSDIYPDLILAELQHVDIVAFRPPCVGEFYYSIDHSIETCSNGFKEPRLIIEYKVHINNFSCLLKVTDVYPTPITIPKGYRVTAFRRPNNYELMLTSQGTINKAYSEGPCPKLILERILMCDEG